MESSVASGVVSWLETVKLRRSVLSAYRFGGVGVNLDVETSYRIFIGIPCPTSKLLLGFALLQ